MQPMHGFLRILQTSLFATLYTTAWSVLALALLLLVQWPLREWVQAYSRQANDVAQIVFALLAAVSIAAASVAGTHLSAHIPARSGSAATQPAWRRWALAVCVLPWAVFMLLASAPQAWQALVGLEKFGETLTPGFFIIKCAGMLMVVLILLQTLLQLLTSSVHPESAQEPSPDSTRTHNRVHNP